MKISNYSVAYVQENSLSLALKNLIASIDVLLDMGYVPLGSMTHVVIDDEGEGRYHYVCQPMVLKEEE